MSLLVVQLENEVSLLRDLVEHAYKEGVEDEVWLKMAEHMVPRCTKMVPSNISRERDDLAEEYGLRRSESA